MSDNYGHVASQWNASLGEVDPELAALIEREGHRQASTLSMVASENFAAKAVLDAQGSILSNKYANGYPGHREYDGCEVVDEIENLAIERAKSLFGAEHANVQPYSGSSANAIVLRALCKPGDVVLGFDFEHGGHPTQYDAESTAGHFYRGIAYHVRQSDRLVDLDEVEQLAHRHHPKVIFAGWSCYSRFLDFAAFREIADEVGARLVVDMAHFSGLVAAKLHPDPVPYADVATMTVHKTLGGARGGAILSRRAFAAAIDEAVFPGEQGSPLIHVVAAKAATFGLCATDGFKERAQRTVNGARTIAAALVDAASDTKMDVVTGGTDVHQLLVDTSRSDNDARDVLEWLHAIDITANAIRIAFDPRERPGVSGLRLGTPSLAARGFDDAAFVELAQILIGAPSPGHEARVGELRRRTAALCAQFPPIGHGAMGGV